MKERIKSFIAKLLSIKFLVYSVAVGLFIYHQSTDTMVYLSLATGTLIGVRSFEKIQVLNNKKEEKRDAVSKWFWR